MNFRVFLKNSIVLLLCGMGAGVVLLRYYHSDDFFPAVLLGIAIAYANALLGFALLSWGFRRSQRDFLLSFFGGMILRFLLIFALLFILIGALEIDLVALLLSLLVSYFLFLGLEIFHVHTNAETERKI